MEAYLRQKYKNYSRFSWAEIQHELLLSANQLMLFKNRCRNDQGIGISNTLSFLEFATVVNFGLDEV